ncbi:MAG TPA: tetratricopeptide repeat-containing sensor histidine kinase [Cyclobacteriaceae bacterium]|nr:tetratricopeptide repeat-containing sensor histidine kinase [Cyclobacteriaceae bacterium]HMV10502.1 tetratricopeptide repeat-containing sensor histidine kinase [Cyclobacteriaceae bacterium]HMV89945.1 tetratricopeptide repeat-containing sensor histidine kinase [Cyclobacteriaceae bacterium]HMX01795.1 tetratricopeptide repeat-containing sensor histidine kinase [Cyclobacteriaceae bacterium]HMX51542.1 tetratricopeptide repeat-containing sensor histidine kinase [Cyclobacteriaceae bacterium]
MKVFFACMVCVCLLQPLIAQDNASQKDVEWFEGFFSRKPSGSLSEWKEKFNDETQDAQEQEDRAAQVRSKIKMGLITLTHPKEQEESKYELALEYFISAKAQADTLNLKAEQVLIYLSMARVFEEAGNHAKAIDLLTKAQTVDRKADDPLSLLVLNELGRVYTDADSTDEAQNIYGRLLQLARDSKQEKREADALFYLGVLNTRRNSYDSALMRHKDALRLKRKLQDKAGEVVSLNTIGDLYLDMKNDDRALANYVAALEISQALKDDHAIAISYNNAGKLYFHQKNYQRAISNFDLGLQKAQQAKNPEQMKISADFLSQCYKELGEFQRALQYREQSFGIESMIQREKDERKLLDMENSSVLEAKEQAIDKLEAKRLAHEKQLQEERQTRYLLFALVGLTLIVAALVFSLYRSKQKSNLVLQAANEKIMQQNVQLQQLNATKDKFFSIISHDLKGPLNSLTSFSGLLINYFDSLSKEEIQTLAKDLDKSLKNLFALLENLLEWSRSQTGAIEFKPAAFDLSELVQENIDLLTAQAAAKSITLHYEDPQPANVMAHKNSVTTVIRNLISNAIKFTPAGGTITLSVKSSADEALVSIADTGVGMSKEVIDKIFRIDAKHSTKGTADEKGTGLGLVLCKDFVEKNRGNIGVHSEEGKGSTFYFTLPVA